MEDKNLKDLLHSIEPPEADENAKKRALNLALAAFSEEQKKNKKTFQGFSTLSRLMGNSTDKTRGNPMEQQRNKKLVYGGMATAMAVVLIAGTTLMQTQGLMETVGSKASFGSSAPQVNATEFKVDGVPGISGQVAPAMRQEIETANQREAEDPLQRWRRLQEEPAMQGQAMADAQLAAPAPQALMKMESAKRSQDFAAGAPSNALVISPGAPIMADDTTQPYYKDRDRDKFEKVEINPFKQVAQDPVSTFSVDVDTASYAFVRRQINQGQLPNPDSVRVEEMVNYFDYNYPAPTDKAAPFKASVTVTASPWHEGRKLMHVGIKGYEMDITKAKSNLVFLLDTSGSMNSPDKLPLLISSFKLMLDTLNPDDTVAIAVYAGSAGTVLEPTKVADKQKIIAALDNLRAGGGTAGGAGIALAYSLAEQNFDKEAVNRVILATDGDFNVGMSSNDELKTYIEQKRNKGIFLSVLGFGQGNYNDQLMQTLAQNGNGTAAYIDTLNEARKVLVEEAGSTLFPIAKDVKLQVEFNPAAVSEYRLVGYETRSLNREDFNNDKVDAGDIGAGHKVTAIYEFTPVGVTGSVDPLRYGSADAPKAQEMKADANFADEYAFLKIRYKLPNEDTSQLITTPVLASPNNFISLADHQLHCPELKGDGSCEDTIFSIAVASFAQMLKGGEYTGTMTYDDVITMAQESKGEDKFGYRNEFIQMVRLAKSLSGK